MKDIDCVLADPVKNPKWIANNGDDADLRALRNARSSPGCVADAINNIVKSARDGFSYRGLGLAE
jgi:hypothetical protein